MAKKRWGTRLLDYRLVDLSVVAATKLLVWSVVMVAAACLLWFLAYVLTSIFHPPMAYDLSARTDAALFWIFESGFFDAALMASIGLVAYLATIIGVEISLNVLDDFSRKIRGRF